MHYHDITSARLLGVTLAEERLVCSRRLVRRSCPRPRPRQRPRDACRRRGLPWHNLGPRGGLAPPPVWDLAGPRRRAPRRRAPADAELDVARGARVIWLRVGRSP